MEPRTWRHKLICVLIWEADGQYTGHTLGESRVRLTEERSKWPEQQNQRPSESLRQRNAGVEIRYSPHATPP